VPEIKRKKIESQFVTQIAFIALLVCVTLVFSLLQKNFLSVKNINNIFKHLSITAIASLGVTYVVIIGKIDMSFYMTACFSAMTMSWIIKLGLPPSLAVLAGLFSGAVFGFLSGVLVGTFGLPDIITTIGTGSVAFGVAYLFSDGAFIYDNFMSSGISYLNEGSVFGIPLPTVIMLLLFAASYIYLNKSLFGRYYYATGENPIAAFFSGVKTKRYIIYAFVICSVMASVSTMITTAAQGNGNVKSGLNLLMPSFVAVYIGISAFKRPNVIGTFLGALFVEIMLNGFTLLNVPYYYGDVIVSVMLIISITMSKYEIIRAHFRGKLHRNPLMWGRPKPKIRAFRKGAVS
jgi:ribose/xylose/arabinose/galactoside ABC-type transport system permease subunit